MDSPNAAQRDNLINQAWENYRDGDKTAIDDIYDILMPFCLRVSSKTCGRYVDNGEEEASIANMAIVEALDKFNPAKGSFLVFLGQIIRNRIIDYKRKESKKSIIPFSFLSKGGATFFTEDVDDSFFEGIIDDLARKQEIDSLKILLLEFNISFEELVQISPRQVKTRENVQKIALLIAENEHLNNYLMERKLLPMKDLEEKWNVNRKIADRYRKFIITAVLIHLYDFPYLKTYVLPVTRGDENGW